VEYFDGPETAFDEATANRPQADPLGSAQDEVELEVVEDPGHRPGRADAVPQADIDRPRGKQRRRRRRRSQPLEKRYLQGGLGSDQDTGLAEANYYLCLSGAIACFLVGLGLLLIVIVTLMAAPKAGVCLAVLLIPFAALILYMGKRLLWD
jgi:hypothetical protein